MSSKSVYKKKERKENLHWGRGGVGNIIILCSKMVKKPCVFPAISQWLLISPLPKSFFFLPIFQFFKCVFTKLSAILLYSTAIIGFPLLSSSNLLTTKLLHRLLLFQATRINTISKCALLILTLKF